MLYEELVAQLNKLKGVNTSMTWRVEDIKKNTDGVEIVFIANKETGEKKVVKLTALLQAIMQGNCCITNPSALQNCAVFKGNSTPIVVKLSVTTDSYSNEVDYLKIKTPDGKSKREIEGILLEVSKKVERFSAVRNKGQLSPAEQKVYDLYMLYGFTIDFFVDYMTKVLGWTVDFMNFDICVELR